MGKAKVNYSGQFDKKDLKGLKLDEEDHQNIANAIKVYELAHPRGQYLTNDEGYTELTNLIDHTIYVRQTLKTERKLKFGKEKDGAFTLAVSVPPTFRVFIEKSYPTLFTDKEQTNQFLRWFPAFDLRR